MADKLANWLLANPPANDVDPREATEAVPSFETTTTNRAGGAVMLVVDFG